MKYALINGGKVSQIFESRPLLHPDILLIECGDGVQVGWVYDGEQFTAPPVPTPEQIAAVLETAATQAVENLINAELATRSYQPNGTTLANYAGLTDTAINSAPTAMQPIYTLFRDEAQTAQAWMISCWAVMAAISAGAIPRPATIPDLIALMPTMQWPEGSNPR